MTEQYKNGKLNGVTKTFYNEGTIYEIKNWSDNILNGVWKQFYLNGNLKMTALYKNNKREGKSFIIFLMAIFYLLDFIKII